MTTSTDLKELKGFINRFSVLEQSLQRLKIERDLSKMQSFLSNFGTYENLAFRFKEAIAPTYNVFELLKIKHLEAKVHTPFLGNLLDPDGTHCQGRLFFDAFFGALKIHQKQINEIHNIEVLEEHPNPYGRLDILIKYKIGNENFALTIENKIYAKDQEKQLERYYLYSRHILKLKTDNFHLIYLCPTKKKPTIPFSIRANLYRPLKSRKILREIGYQEDISKLLNNCFSQIKAPVVKQTLHQYLQIIKTF